ncbi:NAD-specific glutamate dehydrogenase, putative [Babesia ovis]|uniref:NAD-specific glutamate dehydrogenase, putative n=1 Tax=Babesia ovis TaxID=5869 RepID=A0A9W5TEN9_BABOV|nr:NAD-specific glutamate dehydrogenase, putative [Babesia ovis]
MKLRGITSLWRLVHIVAPRKPYLANGVISRVAEERIGKHNPFLSLLRIGQVPPGLYQYCDKPNGLVAPIYDKDTVRYACLSLCHLVSSGFGTASTHIYRLLDIVENSRDVLVQLDIRILLEVLRACETILCLEYPALRRRHDAGIIDVTNAVREKSRVCASYIVDHVSTVGGHLIHEFAPIVYRMGYRNKGFTKMLIREVNENGHLCPSDSLVGSLEYLVHQEPCDLHGSFGAIYRILELLSHENLSWKCTLEVLSFMAKLNVVHPIFLDAVTSAMLCQNDKLGIGIIGMDTVSSRNLCSIIGHVAKLSLEHADMLCETFLNRYTFNKHGDKTCGLVTRDMSKCGIGHFLDLLKAIVAKEPELDGPGRSWAKYILQQRIRCLVHKTSLPELQELFHVLSMLDPGLYYTILVNENDTKGQFGIAMTSVTSVLWHNAPYMGPKALAKAVMCYCVSTRHCWDSALRNVLYGLVYIMCSDALAMVSKSSYITSKILSEANNTQGDVQDLLLCRVDSIMPSISMMTAITAGSQSKFLYDPSVGSNYKYLKRGESRLEARSKAAERMALGAGARRSRGKLVAVENTSNELSISKHVLSDRQLDTEELAIAAAGESTNTLMEVLRIVHQSLCTYHHLFCVGLDNPYSEWGLRGLQTVDSFLKVYKLFFQMHGSRFDSLERECALYGVDGSYNSKALKALRSLDTGYVDPRFLCTPETRALHEDQNSNRPIVTVPGAKLRNVHVDVIKPRRSKVKLNWDHFGNPDSLGYITRPKIGKKLGESICREVDRVSQQVDYEVHGRRDVVECYNDYVATHFKGKLACYSNYGDKASSQVNVGKGISTSRLHKEVQHAVVGTTNLSVISENTGLDGSTHGHSLIGVDRLGSLLAENALDNVTHTRHTGHSTNKNDVIQVLGSYTGILETLLTRFNSSLEEVITDLLQLGTGEFELHVLGTAHVCRDERQVDLGLSLARELNLCRFGSLTEPLESQLVVGKVNALLLLELCYKVLQNALVKVLTTKRCVTVGCLDLKHTTEDFQDGNIEGTTTQIVNGNGLSIILFKAESQSGGCGLVNDPQNIETRNLTRILRCLSLGVVEVGGDRNYRLGYLPTENGCVNAFTSHINGTLMSNNLYCEQCNCDNPQIGRKDVTVVCKTDAGCGWVGRRFKRIECSSCGVIETMLQSRYLLPPPLEPSEESYDEDGDNPLVEVILEPYVLLFCLLRRLTGTKFLMVPISDELFAGGPMPAAFVEDKECFSGEPLRQEQLMNYILKAGGASEDAQRVLRSEFALYESQNISEQPGEIVEDTRSYHNSGTILPAYVYKHLRYAILFIIWVYPRISQNVTKNIVLNSTPWPYGYYVYHRRAREVARECAQCGYSNIDFTLKELGLMLKELQHMLQSGTTSLIYRPGYWTEGLVFANLAILFSIPCHGIEELLTFHREFYDLKAYCASMVRTYNVADLQPPFLSGNTFPVSYFVQESPAPMAFLSSVWEKIANLPPLNLLH